ncbi:10364_t:CDS:2, partial [Racocetra persica]
MEQLTKNQAVATSQEAVQNQNEPQLRDENAHNDKSVHGVLNPTYQAGLRRDAVQPDIEAERKKRDEIEAGKSYCSRRFGGATCDDKSAQIYARFDKNDWRIQPAEFYRFHDAEDWFRYESHFVHGRDSLVDILKERGLLSESDATALASIKLIQASAVLDLTEDDFDFLTSNKVWIATDRSRARRC